MQMQPANGKYHQEQASYVRSPGAHLYTVLHRVSEPIARALLVGPIAAERHYSYSPWVAWARYLAQHGVEVLRFDHRGHGESEGVFEETSFRDWAEDLRFLADWTRDQSPKVPLILHGLEIGAVLAAQIFEAGTGDSLLLWAAPVTANQTMRVALQRWLALEQISKYGGDRKPVSAFIRELEEGSPLEVAGYWWSSRLWHDSFEVGLPLNIQNGTMPVSARARPVKLVSLGKEAAPLVKSGYMPEEEPKDFTELFTRNWEWLSSALSQSREANA